MSRSWLIRLREAAARHLVCGGVAAELQAAGHDVEWSSNWPQDPGDEEILAYEWREARILVTLDKDFGGLEVVQGLRHCRILRIVDFSVRHHGAVCMQAIARHGSDLAAGAIVTAVSRAGCGCVRPSPTRVHLEIARHVGLHYVTVSRIANRPVYQGKT